MAPQRQKRIKRKLPTRNIVDADFVSSSASARIMDDLLLPSHHDRAILSSLWDNQETARSELPHVVIASTHRRLVQPSTNTLEKTYLQRLQEQRKDTTDLSAQSIIPIALVNNMNAKATSTANNATDSDSETETYTNLSPINQQVGMGTEKTFSYGVSHDQSIHDDNTGLCPDETDQFQLSLNVLQVTGIDCLHTQEHEPDHSSVPMVATDESIVNDQAPVSVGQAVMMKGEDCMECEDNMQGEGVTEAETVNVNDMMKEAETVNENDMMDEAEAVNEIDMMDEAENVNEKEVEVVNENGMMETEIVNEEDHIVDNVNEKDDGVDIVVKREYEEESVESDEESAREYSEESASVYNVVKREYEEGSVESDEESAREADEESAREDDDVYNVVKREYEESEEENTREDDEESAGEDEEALVEADEANEEKVVEDHAVENEEEEAVEEQDPVGSSAEPSQPSFDPEEEITLCMRSVEPVPCLFVTATRKNDLVPIKYEPLDESEYASSPEEPTNNALSCSSDEFMNNVDPRHLNERKNNISPCLSEDFTNAAADASYRLDESTNDVTSNHSEEFINTAASYRSDEIMNSAIPVFSQKFINTAVGYYSDEAMNAATSDHSDQTTSNAVFDHSDEITNSYDSDESTNNFLPVYSQKFIPDIPYQTASNAIYDHSDEDTHASVSDRCYAITVIAASDHSSQTASNATYHSDEATHDTVSDRCYAIASNAVSDHFNESMNNVLPCTSDEFMNNIASCYSDVCISEEETLNLQVLSEEPSSCLYRMSASLEREGRLVPIKQEPIDEVAADMTTLANLVNPYRNDMADTEVMVKQEPLERESCADKGECGPMEIEYQDNPEFSDMQDAECSEGNNAEHDINSVCGMVEQSHTDALSVKQQVVDSPSVTSSSNSSSIGDDDDWMAVEDLAEDEQDVVYDKIFDMMARPNESKPIRSKPGQNKGQKRLRLDAWIEDNKSPIVLTYEEEERVCKRRKIMNAKLHKPFIIKKRMKCVWLVEADTA